jgi:hypothetical protein
MLDGDGMTSILKFLLSGGRGCCGLVLSCQTLNVAISQQPSYAGAHPMQKAPEHGFLEPEYVLSQGDEAGWANRW